MPEYVPRWIVPADAPEIPFRATAKTDKSPSVSFGSAAKPDSARNLYRLGLDPALAWRFVYRGPVEASKPPAGWCGIAPAGCGVPKVCRVLGPCQHFTESGRCWKDDQS
jgi:hypothetical protein